MVKDHIGNTTASTTSKVTCVQSSETKDLLTKPITDAKYLDELWAYYFKTQDPYVLERFIDVLHWTENGHGEEIVLGGAAKWSLESNALKYPQILSVCREEMKDKDKTTQKILQNIIQKTAKKVEK